MTRLITTWVFVTAFLFANIAAAGLPPTSTKSQLDTSKSTTFDFQAPFNQFTKPSGTTALIETGNKNLLKDPGFESSDPTAVWVIALAGTVSRTSTAADVGSGSYALSYDAAATNGTVTSAAVAVPNGFIGKTLEASCDIKNTSAGLYKIQAYDGTNVLAEQLITTDSTYFVRNTLRFVSPTSGSISIRFLAGTAGEPVFYVDDCYLGIDRGQGSTQLISEWQSYTPTGSWTSNTTYTGKWRQLGDTAEVQVRLALSGAPTAASLTVNLPSGLVIDTSKLAGGTTQVELPNSDGSMRDDASYNGFVKAFYDSTTSVGIRSPSTATAHTLVIVNATMPITWAANDSIDVTFRVPIVGWRAQTTASIDAISKRGSISFASGSSTVTSGSLTTFNVAGFGTNTLEGQALAPTTANDLGIRMTGAPAGVYEVTAVGKFYASSAATTGTRTVCEFRLYDGTNHSAGAYGIATGAGTYETNDSIANITGLFTLSSAGTINVVVRGQRVSGNGTCYAEAGAYISIKNVSQNSPAIILANSVSTTVNNGVKILTAKVQAVSGATCTVSEEDGDWLGATTPIALGRCTVAINAGTFSATPKCSLTGYATTYTGVTQSLTAHFTNLSTTTMTFETRYDVGGSNAISGDDSPFMLMCVGAR